MNISQSTKAQHNSYAGIAGVQVAGSNQTITVIDNKIERRNSSIMNRYGDEDVNSTGVHE